MVKITAVEHNSPAHRAGVKAGDFLLAIDGHDICDVLDYRFYLTPSKITLKLHRGPDIIEVKVKKQEYSDIGLDIYNFLMD